LTDIGANFYFLFQEQRIAVSFLLFLSLPVLSPLPSVPLPPFPFVYSLFLGVRRLDPRKLFYNVDAYR
jgi:hypothetical protein